MMGTKSGKPSKLISPNFNGTGSGGSYVVSRTSKEEAAAPDGAGKIS
jgi:hypothetical protein